MFLIDHTPCGWVCEVKHRQQIFHNMSYANHACRRQIEKSLLAQIEMSLSAASGGEYWADDGDYDEPDGDRPDGRIARSGRWPDQDRRLSLIHISEPTRRTPIS